MSFLSSCQIINTKNKTTCLLKNVVFLSVCGYSQNSKSEKLNWGYWTLSKLIQGNYATRLASYYCCYLQWWRTALWWLHLNYRWTHIIVLDHSVCLTLWPLSGFLPLHMPKITFRHFNPRINFFCNLPRTRNKLKKLAKWRHGKVRQQSPGSHNEVAATQKMPVKGQQGRVYNKWEEQAAKEKKKGGIAWASLFSTDIVLQLTSFTSPTLIWAKRIFIILASAALI